MHTMGENKLNKDYVRLHLHSMKVCASGIEDNEDALKVIDGLGDFEYEKDLMTNIMQWRLSLLKLCQEADELGIKYSKKYKVMCGYESSA